MAVPFLNSMIPARMRARPPTTSSAAALFSTSALVAFSKASTVGQARFFEAGWVRNAPPACWQARTAVSKSAPRPVGTIATTIANTPPRLRNVSSALSMPCNAIMHAPRPMSAPTNTDQAGV